MESSERGGKSVEMWDRMGQIEKTVGLRSGEGGLWHVWGMKRAGEGRCRGGERK